MKEQKVSREEVEGMGKTIPHEVNLLYILSMACDTMLYDVERRMKAIDETYKIKYEAKHRLKQYLKILSDAKTCFDNFVEPSIIRSCTQPDFSDYEGSRMFAQELIRLVMLYYETCKDTENHNKVFDLLCSLEHGRRGAFTAEDINRFDLKCR